ncbi:MAG: transposase, partial [Xanthomonadales bacterium]|nr:transposase [Xanthomonadales bacterium]
RANRFHIPGAVWHITHRCHGRQFLLKFERDRLRWKHWLFQATQRYDLCVLNYIATSNHVHLLVKDTGRAEIASSMQLISGRTAQEYNQRKSRKGAFWEDRYFATAVSTDRHLIQCLVYLDLNMVRAGVVNHPSQWKVSGFHEIQSPPQRYKIINHQALLELTNQSNLEVLQAAHLNWVTHCLLNEKPVRQPRWTDSIAVGSENFIRQVKAQLKARALYRTVTSGASQTFQIQDISSLES